MRKNREIFLACPIGSENSDTREHADQILRHLIQDTLCRYDEFQDVTVVRADKVGKPGKITTQIYRKITESDVVIADLTGLNPNVLYELGIRQAILKPYILIASKETDLPFDLKDSRTIFYDIKNLDSIADAKNELKNHLLEAFKGEVDQFDEDLFGPRQKYQKNRTRNELRDLRIMETLDSIIDAEKDLSFSVDDLSRRLSKSINHMESLFTKGFGGAGSYLYIDGEKEAFTALVAALSRAKESIRTTRFSPFAVCNRQKEFADMINRRVIGDDQYQPVQYFTRIVSANDMSKLDDIKEYINYFLGRQFTLFLTHYTNNFELVIIVVVLFISPDFVHIKMCHIFGNCRFKILS